jgi:MFS family permease
MFPQLGAPLGFICSASVFLQLDRLMSESQFFAWGWRVPFLASSVLVLVGLYVRLRITETPAFRRAIEHNERVQLPLAEVFRVHGRLLLLGTLATVATFAVFYLMTVFSLSWGTARLGWTRDGFLVLQMIAVLFFGLAIVVSALLADRLEPRIVLTTAAALLAVFGLFYAPLLTGGGTGPVMLCLSLGLALMGLTYGPLGAALGALFPTAVRYTGASFTFNFAGILGASLTPYAATWLASRYGLPAVGWYLTGASLLSLAALLLLPRGAMAKRPWRYPSVGGTVTDGRRS